MFPKGTLKLDGRLLFTLREVIKFPHVRRRLYFTWYQKKRIVATKCPAYSGELNYHAGTPCMVEAYRRECIALPLVARWGWRTTCENSSSIFHRPFAELRNCQFSPVNYCRLVHLKTYNSRPRQPIFGPFALHILCRQDPMYTIKLWIKFM